MAGILVDATPSGLSANSYLTDQQMSDALEGRHPLTIMDAWDELENDARCALLIHGTKLIDGYPRHGWGARKVEDQRLSFPRADDIEGVIGKRVQEALVEYVALQLESGGEMAALKRLQAEGITSTGILSQNVSQSKDESELPAGARRILDQLIAAFWPESAVKNPEVRGHPDFDFFG